MTAPVRALNSLTSTVIRRGFVPVKVTVNWFGPSVVRLTGSFTVTRRRGRTSAVFATVSPAVPVNITFALGGRAARLSSVVSTWNGRPGRTALLALTDAMTTPDDGAASAGAAENAAATAIVRRT